MYSGDGLQMFFPRINHSFPNQRHELEFDVDIASYLLMD